MIRRIINRLRRPEPSQKPTPMLTPERGAPHSGGSTGMARLPRPNVKAKRRAANKRARAARRANRVS